MKKQITQKYSKSSESSSDSSPSSSVVDEKLPRKLQTVIDGYLSIDKRHRPSDIKVFIDDKSGETRWSCPCNPHRKGPYEWQGVDKMRRHTSSRLHLEYMDTRKAPKPAKKRPVDLDIVFQKYMSINPEQHQTTDITAFVDPKTKSVKWTCFCSGSTEHLWGGVQRMKLHTASIPHELYLKNRFFDSISWWRGQGLSLDMLKIKNHENGEEEARCRYCADALITNMNDKEEFEKHVKLPVHRTRVIKHQQQKGISKANNVENRKRERSPKPLAKEVISNTKLKDVEKKDLPIIEISEDLPKATSPIRPKKRERSPSPHMEKDEEMEKELKKYALEQKKAFIDHIYKKAYAYVDESKNVEAEIQERYKKLVSKTLDEVFE